MDRTVRRRTKASEGSSVLVRNPLAHTASGRPLSNSSRLVAAEDAWNGIRIRVDPVLTA
jgi:hypothetical protein